MLTFTNVVCLLPEKLATSGQDNAVNRETDAVTADQDGVYELILNPQVAPHFGHIVHLTQAFDLFFVPFKKIGFTDDARKIS